MSALSDRHTAEVNRIANMMFRDARLAGIELTEERAREFVRYTLDQYTPVGVWSEFREDERREPFARNGVWKRWDIRIGCKVFSYKMFENDGYQRDPGYLAHIKRTVQRRMGTSIATWVTGEKDPEQERDPVEIQETS